jgi:hypothetical protein
MAKYSSKAEPACSSLKGIVWIVLVLLYVSPLFILKEDASIRVHDTFDANFPILKLYVDHYWGNGTVEPILGGLPQEAFAFTPTVFLLILKFFSLFNAFMVNELILRLIGFIGLYLLCEQHLLKGRPLLSGLFAAAFATLPFWSPGNASVTGQPLLIFLFLKLKEHNKISLRVGFIWFCIFLLGSYINLVLAGVFICGALIAWLLWLYVSERKFFKNLFIGIIIFIFSFLPGFLPYAFAPGHVVWHREEFAPLLVLSLKDTFMTAVRTLVTGNFANHIFSLAFPFIWISVLLSVFFASFQKKKVAPLFLPLLGASVVVSVWAALYYADVFIPVKRAIPLLDRFQANRLYYFLPAIIFVLFVLAAKTLIETRKTLLVFVLVAFQIIYNFKNDSFIFGSSFGYPTFRQFFSTRTFEEIRRFVGLPTNRYRIGCLGFHPSVAFHNGFYTIDGYWYLYPLDYKHKFRKIISPELDKSPSLREYFDYWGSRCYIASAEIGMLIDAPRPPDLVLKNWSWDEKSAWDLGCRFLFSKYKIVNAVQNNVSLLKAFPLESQHEFIYVYKLEQPRTY